MDDRGTLSGTGLPSTWWKRIRGFWMQEVEGWAGHWLGLGKHGAMENEDGSVAILCFLSQRGGGCGQDLGLPS